MVSPDDALSTLFAALRPLSLFFSLKPLTRMTDADFFLFYACLRFVKQSLTRAPYSRYLLCPFAHFPARRCLSALFNGVLMRCFVLSLVNSWYSSSFLIHDFSFFHLACPMSFHHQEPPRSIPLLYVFFLPLIFCPLPYFFLPFPTVPEIGNYRNHPS